MPIPTPQDVQDAIARNAAEGIAKATTDVGSVEAHSLKDQIEAAKFLAAKSVAAKPHRAIRFARLVPPGAD